MYHSYQVTITLLFFNILQAKNVVLSAKCLKCRKTTKKTMKLQFDGAAVHEVSQICGYTPQQAWRPKENSHYVNERMLCFTAWYVQATRRSKL